MTYGLLLKVALSPHERIQSDDSEGRTVSLPPPIGTVKLRGSPRGTAFSNAPAPELGYRQTEASERVAVRSPTEAEADALEISPERNVLDIVHLGKTADGRVVEVTTTVTPAHYLIIENTFALA